MEAHHSKRVRNGDGPSVTVIETVLTFVAERPLSIDEVPSRFVVTSGLQRKDTVAGSSEAATIWSESVVIIRDMI